MVLHLFAFLALANATDCSTTSSSSVTSEQCRVKKENFEKKLNTSNQQSSTPNKDK